LRWCQEDPEACHAQAQGRMDDLARPLLGAGSQALCEVQDVGTMLVRLA
jgi:hypothetical protein